MLENATRQQLLGSELFDPGFYRETYGHLAEASRDPLGHFLTSGLEQGHLSSASFDPVLYRVLVPECGDANPLQHCLASGAAFQPGPLTEIFPDAVRMVAFSNPGGNLQLHQNRKYAGSAAAPREIPFSVSGKEFSLKVPEPDAFMEELSREGPLAVVRLPEGYWETVWILRALERALSEDRRTRSLAVAQRRALATRLAAAVFPRNGNFAPSFMDEVQADVCGHAEDTAFQHAVAFKGYPTFDEKISGRRAQPPRAELMELFAEQFRPGRVLYDATLWKRLLIAGHLARLPVLLHRRPVVMVGPAYLAPLGSHWKLGNFTHVEIPASHTQYRRWDLLARCRAALETARSRGPGVPVVLTQCGAALAYWLIVRLRAASAGASYLDVGQAINGWFLHERSFKGAPWMRVYGRSIIANCRLEPYYEALRGDRYPDWLSSLP
jgi:hypothetical protein